MQPPQTSVPQEKIPLAASAPEDLGSILDLIRSDPILPISTITIENAPLCPFEPLEMKKWDLFLPPKPRKDPAHSVCSGGKDPASHVCSGGKDPAHRVCSGGKDPAPCVCSGGKIPLHTSVPEEKIPLHTSVPEERSRFTRLFRRKGPHCERLLRRKRSRFIRLFRRKDPASHVCSGGKIPLHTSVPEERSRSQRLFRRKDPVHYGS